MQNPTDSQLFDGVPPPDGHNADAAARATPSGRFRAAPNRAELEAMPHNELIDYTETMQKELYRLDKENAFISWEHRSSLLFFSRIANIAHRLNSAKLDTVVNVAIDDVAGHFKCGAAAFFIYNQESRRFDLIRATRDASDLAGYGEREVFLSKLFISRDEPHIVNCNVEGRYLEFENGEISYGDFPENWPEIFKTRALVFPLKVQTADGVDAAPLGGVVFGDAGETLEERDAEEALLFAELLSFSMHNVRLLERLNALAIIDPLTNIYNRRHFLEQLDMAMSLANRQGHDLCIAMIDIDYFKIFNDDYGHVYGDKVLREVATVLKNGIREAGDVAARYGGEEFILIMPFANLKNAVEVAERLRSAIWAHRISFDHTTAGVTCSFGVTQYVSGEDLEAFIDRADIALYRAKKNGRNRVVAEMGY